MTIILLFDAACISFISRKTSIMTSALSASYVYLVTHVVPGPRSLSYFAPSILLPCALMISPSSLSRVQLVDFFLVPIYASTIHAWLAMGGVDVISVNVLLWATFLIGLQDPRKTFKRVRCSQADVSDLYHQGNTTLHGAISNKGKNAKKFIIYDEPYPSKPLPRLRWVMTLIGSMRLTAWKTGSSRLHDERQAKLSPPRTRRRFFLRNIFPQLVLSLSLLHFTVRLAEQWPSFSGLQPADDDQAVAALLTKYIPTTILRPLVLGCHAYAVVTLQYLLRAPFVLLSNYHFNVPRDSWALHTLPNRCGAFSAVLDKGLPGLWGEWWHQVCFSSPVSPQLTHTGHACGSLLTRPCSRAIFWSKGLTR